MKYLLDIKAVHPHDLGADAKAAIVARLEQVLDEEGFDNIDTVLNGQGGHVTEGRVFSMSQGSVVLGPNGLNVRSTTLDPAEIRAGAPVGQLAVAKFSGDIIRDDGVAEEIAFVLFKRDERLRSDPHDKTGTAEIWVRNDRIQGNDDRKYVRVLTCAVDGVVFHVPIHLTAGAYINGAKIV